MLHAPILVENKQDISKINEVFELGIPFPKGAFEPELNICLLDQTSSSDIPFGYKVTANWPDGSIKWALFTFTLSLPPTSSVKLSLSEKSESIPNDSASGIKLETNFTEIETSEVNYLINHRPFSFYVKGAPNEIGLNGVKAELFLRLDDGTVLDATIEQVQFDENLVLVGEGYSTLNFMGEFTNTSGISNGKFILALQCWQNRPLIKWDITLWNPEAAQHPGGCWDLGDVNSLVFKEMILRLNGLTDSELLWKSGCTSEWLAARSGFTAFQSGSGCEKSHSNVHKTADGQNPKFFNGFKVYESSQKMSDKQEGGRLNPQFFLNAGLNSMSVSIEKFWQNFPKAVSYESDSLLISLFPANAQDDTQNLYELQPGERKTHRLYFNFSAEKNALNWVNNPSECRISSEWYIHSQAFPFMCKEDNFDVIRPLIRKCIEGKNSFIEKRERIDEYGWRNFGDLYADHETLYQKPSEEPFISHYNNQYDAIYGLSRQYVQTGDRRWYDLMDDLARHVCDIDIYHTEKDKVEYNGGLFWHTDHYLDAKTCTHRTFSKWNSTSSIPGQTGGGPGSEHCYTSGLMHHYYLTGNEQSKKMVSQLTDWMVNIHEGGDGLLAQVLSVKKVELKKLVELLKGNRVLAYRYPLTRGTGNYINALLDAFSLEGALSRLIKVEHIIKETVHPSDNMSERHFEDIENTWSYLVFLQAVAKYLSIKEGIEQIDDAYLYARASFLRYAQWMLENENPYMTCEDKLEYPNDTWAAQDIRKVNIFVLAGMYVSEDKTLYLARAQEFLSHIVERLSASNEVGFTRIQVILLQNYGFHQYLDPGTELPLVEGVYFDQDFGEVKLLTLPKVVNRIFLKLFKGLRHFSLNRELAWLKTRG